MDEQSKREPGDELEDDEAFDLDLDVDEVDLEAATEEALRALEDSGGESDADGQTVEAVAQDLDDLRSHLMRTLADFDNFRKRVDRERVDFERYASSRLLADFLPIIDNLGRALDAGGSLEDLKSGVDMIGRQMVELLRQHGVKEVAAADQHFDPSIHEAVARVEDPEAEKPRVVEVYQKGYRLHDRLLRPALVRVGVPAERKAESPAGGDE